MQKPALQDPTRTLEPLQLRVVCVSRRYRPVYASPTQAPLSKHLAYSNGSLIHMTRYATARVQGPNRFETAG
eukprot:1033764-Rhodomonas_salina.5